MHSENGNHYKHKCSSKLLRKKKGKEKEQPSSTQCFNKVLKIIKYNGFFFFFFLGLKKKGKLKKRTKSKDSFGGLVQILGAI